MTIRGPPGEHYEYSGTTNIDCLHGRGHPGHQTAVEPIVCTEEDVQAIKRLVEPIGWKHGFAGQAIDDITQESLIVMTRKFDGQEHGSVNYRGEAFSSKQIARAAKFACFCAIRIARNHRRSARRRSAVPLEDVCHGVVAPRQLDEIGDYELLDCVRNKLSPKENQICQILQEGFEEGLTIQEVASRWGKRKHAFYKARKRLMAKVRKIIYESETAHPSSEQLAQQSRPPPSDHQSG